jgi:hypothetical protein
MNMHEEERLAALETKLVGMAALFSRLCDRLADEEACVLPIIAKAHDRLADRVEALEAKVGRHGGRLHDLETDVDDLMTQVEG